VLSLEQVKDWENHKYWCKLDQEQRDHRFTNGLSKSRGNMALAFIEKNMSNIIEQCNTYCEENGVDETEILMEVDLSNHNPALTGQIQFTLAKSFFDRKQDRKQGHYSDWFGEDFWENIKKEHKRMIPNQLIYICRFPDLTASCGGISPGGLYEVD